MIATKYGKMNVIAADRVVSNSLSLYGEWAGDELVFLNKLIKPGMNVLDVGAFIGTHTLAFSKFVGESGGVYSFEPRREIHQVLSSNIQLNDLKNVHVFNMGLAEAPGTIALESIDITESVNFGGLSINDVVPKEINNIYEVDISTVDSLDVPSIDFIKLDVEGMERLVLEGARNVVSKDRPLIFCECNSLASGYEIFEFCNGVNYTVFAILSDAYNPENFNGVAENIFGDAKEVSLLLAPATQIEALERAGLFESLIQINNLEDFVLPLLHKPQYAHEVLAYTESAKKLGLYFPSPLNDRERVRQKNEYQSVLIEKERRIDILEFNAVQSEQKIVALAADADSKQQVIYSLHSDIQALVTSTSWRVTAPVRFAMRYFYKLKKILPMVSAYYRKYPGLKGVSKLFSTVRKDLGEGGVPALKNRLRMFRQTMTSPVQVNNSAAKVNAVEIDKLKSELASADLIIDTIVFDHNGGGGSNAYTSELIAVMLAENKPSLRVYCWEADWYVQLRTESASDAKVYSTSSLEELFACLAASGAKNIVVNSFYGYKFIEQSIDHVIDLKNCLGAALDFKVHDFHALCPSPHLSDSEQKYCGVPVDHNVCKKCLPKNLSWYHAWLNESDRAVDIDAWRSPFQKLFDVCDVITCFDASSIDILLLDFVIPEEKFHVVPHQAKYLASSRKVAIPEKLSVGVIGTLSHIKGGDSVSALCSYIDNQALEVPVVIIGESYTPLPDSAIVYGRYSPVELPSIIESTGVSVVLMASIVPETFSYTISEAIEMGMPIVAFDIGAQGRRVKEYRLGKVVPVGAAPEEILAAIQSIHKAAKE
ncbi:MULTISPECIES: FkbM family methyltransferase [unclassified Pseudomonas]|uniref:FkbM family methyltransferase n=1 Tax=unclassified Pseudomonas TaxID=196821 RepID=UPI000A1FCE8D|nr:MULTISPECIES: FkbM family methyltransferase [unclassified Pseudomonas]